MSPTLNWNEKVWAPPQSLLHLFNDPDILDLGAGKPVLVINTGTAINQGDVVRLYEATTITGDFLTCSSRANFTLDALTAPPGLYFDRLSVTYNVGNSFSRFYLHYRVLVN